MGLKNTHDSTIKDLKATFFDLFSEHTEELVGMIQLLATDSTVDVMKVESLIFQRIVMLNNAALNVKNVVTDIDYLSAVKGVGAKGKKKKEEDVNTREVSEISHVSAMPATKPAMIPTPATVPAAMTMPTTTAPVAMPTTAPIAMPTTAPIAMPTTAPVAVTTPPVPVAAAPTMPITTAPPAMPTTVPIAMPTTVPMAISTPETTPVVDEQKQTNPASGVQRKTLSEVISERANKKAEPPAKKLRFVKSSDDKVKAILVNGKQYQKLCGSLVMQTKLLDFGISTGEEPSREKIEALMKKASALYKEGKISEAQALYAEISSLNKQLKKTDTKVLSKVA